MEKRSRKRSRKASERDELLDEPSPTTPAKARRRGSNGRGGQIAEGEMKAHGGRALRSKTLRVSFDIIENRLSVGDSETPTSVGAVREEEEEGRGGQCTLSLSSGSGADGDRGPENSTRHFVTAEARDLGSRKQVEMKFKKADFTFSFLSGNKKRSWKSYKQITAAERAQQWRPNDPTFTSLDAPPPLKPAKKYSDLSGLAGKYHDPMSGLLFNSSDEYHTIRSLPPDIVSGYLALRGKLPIM